MNPDDQQTNRTSLPESVTRRAFLAGAGAVGLAGARGGTDADATARRRQDEAAIPARLPSALDIDPVEGTVTLPLYRGQAPTGEVYYVVFETSDFRQARQRGLNWSPKLTNALGTNAVQDGA